MSLGVRVRKEAAHGVHVEPREIGRVELLVVGHEELLGDAAAEARVEHLLEVASGAVVGARWNRSVRHSRNSSCGSWWMFLWNGKSMSRPA